MNVVVTKWLRFRHSESTAAMLFLAPALIGYAIFFLTPLVRGVQISMTKWNLLTDAVPVGFSNYARLLEDENFWNALKVTVIYVLVNISTQTIAALGIALLMQRISRSVWVRSLLLVPWLIPNVTIGVVTLFLLDPNVGLVNHLLQVMGSSPIAFYGDPDWAIYTIALVNSWRNMGYTALLLFAGMQAIPDMVYEAGAIDGASTWASFRHITVPLLRPILAMVVVVSMIGSFQIFDTVSVTTKGGPGGATRVIYYYIYEKAFQQFEFGYAASMAVILMLILLVLSLIQLRVSRANESDLG